ncbi:photosystem reaction center subunit H [Clostridium fermenticellae]|uniref:Photosystem reaction center subunit H n=1 Tax=Clostridium fermenticellae TaxID=2068654 RepID=A0A386H335_9CLOT|nr:PRC-barrel domain-containing protein [Clostridium fermenticellae]AYD40122.1 photosystem reaction center subunit H [Clostridium fermenticellae]
MYRSKDFMLMEVIDLTGKKLGLINDIIVDFDSRKVLGFSVSSNNWFGKNISILFEDIVSFNSVMIVAKATNGDFLNFKDVKGIDVRDREENIIGIVEDIMFEEKKFNILTLVVSTGIINNFIYGKKIVLVKDIILGDKNIFLNKRSENVSLLSLPHRLFKEDDLDEGRL